MVCILFSLQHCDRHYGVGSVDGPVSAVQWRTHLDVLAMHLLGPRCIFHVSSNAIIKVNEGSGNRAIDVSSLLCTYRAVAISPLTDCAFFDDGRFFIGLFVSFAVNVDDGNSGWIGLVSLHPVGALSYGLQVIGTLEDQKIGLQRNTVGSSDTSSGWTVENAVLYLLLDCLIYGFLVSFL